MGEIEIKDYMETFRSDLMGAIHNSNLDIKLEIQKIQSTVDENQKMILYRVNRNKTNILEMDIKLKCVNKNTQFFQWVHKKPLISIPIVIVLIGLAVFIFDMVGIKTIILNFFK